MDYEKKYKEALEWARKVIQGKVGFVLDEVLEKFPELKESEDERIMKEIHIYLDWLDGRNKDYHPKGAYTIRDMIAWLEKQGESDETKAKIFLINNGYPIDTNGTFPTYEKMYNIIKKGLENQGKQNPADEVGNYDHKEVLQTIIKKKLKEIEEEVNGEDYGIDSLYHAQRILEKTLGKVDGYQSDDGILEHKCAISAVKKLYEQKPTWSEEDEEMLKWLCRIVHSQKVGKAITLKEESELGKWMDKWLNHNPQPHWDWSEEDEKIYQSIMDDTVQENQLDDKQTNWLRDIKYRNQWKPSELQIEALESATENCAYSEYQDCLKELIGQLKKLR